MKKMQCGLLLGAFLFFASVAAHSEVLTYGNESEFMAAAASFGYATFQEGFEDAGVWGALRTPDNAESATSQGITWRANLSGNRITTSSGAARSGLWGMFSTPHGDLIGAPFDSQRDGIAGATPRTIHALGIWVRSNTPGARIRMIIDGVTVDFEDTVLTTETLFYGVIDTSGFSTFEVYETEGKTEDAKFIFFDDAIIGRTGGESFSLGVGIPHVTGNGGIWKTILQVDNNAPTQASFSIALHDGGTEVYSGLFSTAGLGRTIIDLRELVPGITSGTGYILYNNSLFNFRLFYENLQGGGLAEFTLAEAKDTQIGFYFNDLSPKIEWKAITVTNMSDAPASVTLHAVGADQILDSVVMTINPYDKRTGYYTNWFPGIAFTQIERIIAVSSVAGLCGVAISGNADSSLLLFTPVTPAPGFDPGAGGVPLL
ncbi:hypothetical protein [Desulfococcus sp.]|uniref:hypothetical protein n=1 Tax=Desulfococcus sp. TaxID=2025834 RepID=UPI00359333AE